MDTTRGGQFKRRSTTQSSSLDDSSLASEEKRTRNPAERIPFAQRDALKSLTTEKSLKEYDWVDLIALIEAEETDSLLQERKWEQQYPEWGYEKEVLPHALKFYQDPENTDKTFEVTFLHDGTMKIGQHVYGTFIKIRYDQLQMLYTDVNQFSIEQKGLSQLIKLVKSLQQGTRIDGQYERPALVEYLTEKKNYWETKRFDRDSTDEEKKQCEKNAMIYSSFIKDSIELRVKEDN